MCLLLQLPVEILINIFNYLQLNDIKNVMRTCRALNKLILVNNAIWRAVSREKLIIHGTISNRKLNNFSSYDQLRISNNWCKGIYCGKIIVHQHIKYMPWLKYFDSELLVYTAGSEILCLPTNRKGKPSHYETLWKVNVPIVERDDMRINDISRFVVAENLIVCGNRDGSATVLSFENLKCCPRVLYHVENCLENGEVEVSAVELIAGPEKSCAITGSFKSSSLLFWHFYTDGPKDSDKKDGDFCVRDFKFDNDIGVRCLSLHENKTNLAIGLKGNNKPLLVDINKGELMMTVSLGKVYRRESIRDIGWHDHNTIMTVTHAGKLELIDVRSHKVVYEMIDPFQSSMYCVKSDGDRAIVVGTSEYSRCVLFDTRSNDFHIQMYFTQRKTSPVYCLDFDSAKLIAAADRSIASLNFEIKSYSTTPKDYSETFEVCR